MELCYILGVTVNKEEIIMKNKILIGVGLTSLTVLMTACGGGPSDNATVNGDGTVSQGGSVTGGTSTIPSIVNLPCKNTQTLKGEKSDTTVINEKGASGSLTIDCNKSSRGFDLKQGVTNLNITGGLIVDYWFCSNKQGKGLAGWSFTHDLTKGKSKMVWSEGGRAYINCHSNYPSPLPRTISSKNDVENLSDYWSDQNLDYSNCTYSTQSTSTGVSCDESVSDRWVYGKNTSLVDSSGNTHKTSERTTYITTKH